MDFVNKMTGGGGSNNNNNNNANSNEQGQNQQQSSSSSGGGFLGGIGDKLNSAAGGGRESEKNEDYLDKGVDYVQEKFLGQGAQDNEVCCHHDWVTLFSQPRPSSPPPPPPPSHKLTSINHQSAVEQAKDEKISDFIRSQYKTSTGSDVPIQDKETRLG
ncbi:hypothetical protein J1614_012039 [Plenodomus biglobosus]|nr:hypothetical protein J1614_012039 [Plenodomus biglobosus]